MADTLHMETENVHTCATKLRIESENIRQQAQALAISAHTIDWYGPSRDTFQYELEQIAIAMIRLADEGDILAARVQSEATEWQQTDAYFSQQFLQIITPNIPKGDR